MPDPILYIDHSTIRPGKLEHLPRAMKRLSDFIEANNPHILSYSFHLDENERRMTVIAVHPDSAALVRHMEIGDAEFRKFGDLVELSSIAVYGDVDDGVLERLHAKARMLGRGSVSVHPRCAGFSR